MPQIVERCWKQEEDGEKERGEEKRRRKTKREREEEEEEEEEGDGEGGGWEGTRKPTSANGQTVMMKDGVVPQVLDGCFEGRGGWG